jgi:hypothetical protein
MTSSCELRFDDLHIDSAGGGVPDTFIFLFQESDRQVTFKSDCDEEQSQIFQYSTTRDIVLRRLNFGGYTAERARECFEEWLDKERRTNSPLPGFDPSIFTDVYAALSDFSYDEWKRRLKTILATPYSYFQPEYIDETDKIMRDGGGLAFGEDLIIIRAMLDALPDVKEVILDITDLIHAGWIDPDDPICRTRRASDAQPRSILQPTVIIAEGSTDIRALRRSLERLYPYLLDYISFFDYEAANPDGGASYVVKFLRAFSAARIATSILAVFDNDAAGLEACITAEGLDLPDNIKVTILPDIEIARSYPTLGPQGMHEIDVNGTAVSIEIFLGRHNISENNGSLIPIVWGSYNNKVQLYQGSIRDKSLPLDRFLKETENHDSTVDYHARYPELVTLWEHIFAMLQPTQWEEYDVP